MGKEDFEVNSRMFQIFNQYRIDQSSISYRCYGGIVYIEGLIRREGFAEDGVKADIMDTVSRQIKGIKHVKRVKWDLVNMTQTTGGGWVYTKTIKRDEGRVWKMGDPTSESSGGDESDGGGDGGGGGDS